MIPCFSGGERGAWSWQCGLRIKMSLTGKDTNDKHPTVVVSDVTLLLQQCSHF